MRENPLYCSFCGKSQHEVRKFIAGPTVFICHADDVQAKLDLESLPPTLLPTLDILARIAAVQSMKHPSENQSQEVLGGLVERVTYHMSRMAFAFCGPRRGGIVMS